MKLQDIRIASFRNICAMSALLVGCAGPGCSSTNSASGSAEDGSTSTAADTTTDAGGNDTAGSTGLVTPYPISPWLAALEAAVAVPPSGIYAITLDFDSAEFVHPDAWAGEETALELVRRGLAINPWESPVGPAGELILVAEAEQTAAWAGLGTQPVGSPGIVLVPSQSLEWLQPPDGSPGLVVGASTAPTPDYPDTLCAGPRLDIVQFAGTTNELSPGKDAPALVGEVVVVGIAHPSNNVGASTAIPPVRLRFEATGIQQPSGPPYHSPGWSNDVLCLAYVPGALVERSTLEAAITWVGEAGPVKFDVVDAGSPSRGVLNLDFRAH